jgi:hypothetical protein
MPRSLHFRNGLAFFGRRTLPSQPPRLTHLISPHFSAAKIWSLPRLSCIARSMRPAAAPPTTLPAMSTAVCLRKIFSRKNCFRKIFSRKRGPISSNVKGSKPPSARRFVSSTTVVNPATAMRPTAPCTAPCTAPVTALLVRETLTGSAGFAGFAESVDAAGDEAIELGVPEDVPEDLGNTGLSAPWPPWPPGPLWPLRDPRLTTSRSGLGGLGGCLSLGRLGRLGRLGIVFPA